MFRRKLVWVVTASVGLIVAAAVLLLVLRKPSSPVPADVRSAVSFPIYYPVAAKLPAGYTFNADSFSTGGGAVEFTVHNAKGQQLTFTEQPEPSASTLQTFVSSHLALHDTVNIPVGTATIGAIGQNTFVSLPTSSTTWVLVSAPYTIDQSQLKSVLQSLTD